MDILLILGGLVGFVVIPVIDAKMERRYRERILEGEQDG